MLFLLACGGGSGLGSAGFAEGLIILAVLFVVFATPMLLLGALVYAAVRITRALGAAVAKPNS